MRWFNRGKRIEVISAGEMIVYTPGWADRLTILARADFSDDGVEDILILNSNWATEGTYGNADIFLITRDSPNGVFWVLEAESHLDPVRYHPCDEKYVKDFLRETDERMAIERRPR